MREANGEINWQLREAREKRMWSEQKAADVVGVDLQTYHRWETGKQGIRLSSLEMLSAAFGETPEALGFGSRFTKRTLQERLTTSPSLEPATVPTKEVERVTTIAGRGPSPTATLRLTQQQVNMLSSLLQGDNIMAFDPTKRKFFEE
ncbi:MAG TPA: helix-turn-helix transcriptional regulator, partial [Ktedonosporobacter sp.]|nr:helix-turn-helix transcriptional regulator [Ktedonosporobacter sp.]